MKRNRILVLSGIAALLVFVWLTTAAGAGRRAEPAAPLAPLAGAPTVVSYQGQIVVAGTAYSGTGYFKFAIVNAAGATSYWSNDGTSVGGSQPTARSVPLPVTNGLFNVLLGDDSLDMKALDAGVFEDPDRTLRVWFAQNPAGPFAWLSPDRRIAAVPYALQTEEAKNADTLDGLHGAAFQRKYGNVVAVAKSGGDFISVQAALDSITDASDTNRYLVWVGPGVYTGTVTMKQFVDIEGAGELLTTISSGIDAGTVRGANNAELRFLTVRNTGGGSYAIAISNYLTSPRLTHVTATAAGATTTNIGVRNHSSSSTMINVTVATSGGTATYGVYNSYSSPAMTNVTVSASGNTSNVSVYNFFSSPTMTNVTASAAAGIANQGMVNDYSTPTIQSSTIRASGGTNSYGIYNLAGSGSYTVKINNCQVTGSTNTIRNDTAFTVLIGASQLDGGAVTGGGTVKCIGVYDENYASAGYDICP